MVFVSNSPAIRPPDYVPNKRRRIEYGAPEFEHEELECHSSKGYTATDSEKRMDKKDVPMPDVQQYLDLPMLVQADPLSIMTNFDQVDASKASESAGGFRCLEDGPLGSYTQSASNTNRKGGLDSCVLEERTFSTAENLSSTSYPLPDSHKNRNGSVEIDLGLHKISACVKAEQTEISQEYCADIELDADLMSFGMIPDIPIKLLEPERWQAGTLFSVSLLGPQMVVDDADALPFAMLHPGSAKILRELQTNYQADLQLYCQIKQRSRATRTKGGNLCVNSCKLSALLHAVVYGHLQDCEVVGDFLQEHRIYLQDPLYGDKTTKYRNPHRLCQIDDEDRPIYKQRRPDVHLDNEIEVLASRGDVFSSLESGVSLPESLESPFIITPLYPHQKQALTFMMRRERGWAFDAPYDDVWKSVALQHGRTGYLNTITGDQQPFKPPDFRGGILADAMGLGKSLSIIALIASNPSTSVIPLEGLCKGTLLVVPPTLISTWEAQLKSHLREETLSWMRYHGPSRKYARLAACDIVITTYHTISSEWKRRQRGDPTIFGKHWHRIVLDEAHIIRGASTNILQTVCSLDATHRWAVTGTPVQNRLTDLASIFRFLKVYPFCIPRVFDEQITKPWKTGSPEAMSRLISIMRSITLRRNKSVIQLPGRHDEIHFVSFSDDEKRSYDILKASTANVLDSAIENEKRDSRLYLNALQWINSLRLVCNLGPAYLSKSRPVAERTTWSKKTAQLALESMESAGTAICAECSLDLGASHLDRSDLPDNQTLLPRLFECLQIFCGECFLRVEEAGSQTGPFICGCQRRCQSFEVSSSNSSVPPDLEDLPKPTELPSKVKKLIQELKSSASDEKCAVFSFWTSTLDLVARALKETIPYARLDGRMSAKERAAAVRAFITEPEVKVMLLSMSCGAVGLDLTVATRVYLMEPQWNPMIEDQALDRVHRIGQTSPVTTVRFIVKDSFEENIRNMQTRKRHLADISMSQSPTSSGLSQSKLEFYRALIA